MLKAYVLVKTREPERVKEYLEGFEEVEEIHIVYGGYDLVVEVRVPDVERLGRFVMGEIRARFHVDDTQTLIVAD